MNFISGCNKHDFNNFHNHESVLKMVLFSLQENNRVNHKSI